MFGWLPFGRGKRRVVVERDSVTTKKRKGGRPTKAEALERQQQRIAELEARLKLKSLEKKLKDADDGAVQNLRLTDVPKLQESLRLLGYKLVPARSASSPDEGPGGLLRDLLDTEAGAAFAQTIGAAIAPAVAGALKTPPTQPAARAESAPLPSPAAQAAGPETADATVQLIRQTLEKATPDEAAAMLLDYARKGQPAAVELANALAALDDSDEAIARYLATKLQDAPTVAPDLVPLLQWLASSDRFPWFCATVRAFRSLLRAPAPNS